MARVVRRGEQRERERSCLDSSSAVHGPCRSNQSEAMQMRRVTVAYARADLSRGTSESGVRSTYRVPWVRK